MKTTSPVRRSHSIPLLSPTCQGWTCRHCPTPWRFFVTGADLRGHQDNATFLHDATEDYRGRPYVKLSRARWRRVARRNAALSVPAGLAIAGALPWFPIWPVLAYVALLLAGVLVWLGWRGVELLRTGKANREWIDPAAAVACRVLKRKYVKRRARKMIDLPPGWGSGADRGNERMSVRVHIPANTPLSAPLRKQLVDNVGARLGIPNPLADWREAGAHVSVDIKAAPVPPAVVPLSAMGDIIERLPEDELVAGRAPGGSAVSVSLSEDSPHFAMSGPSGTGKSALARLLLAQRLRLGDGVMILDPKKFSHIRWAGKLGTDRVRYAYRTEDIHAAWLALAEEVERRIELPEDELMTQRRVFILAEEINVQTKRLVRYWKGERKRIMLNAKAQLADAVQRCGGSVLDGRALALSEGLDEAELDPPTASPAVVAMQELSAMGRELRMHLIVAAQRLSASVFGGNGGDYRENFQGGRFIARWDRKLWRMLVDTVDYVACPAGSRGIWGIARGEEFIILRVPFMSDAEALDMAMSGRVSGPVLGPQDNMDTDTDIVLDNTIPVLDNPRPLSEIVQGLPDKPDGGRLSLKALEMASGRPGFPAPLSGGGRGVVRLYREIDVLDWFQNRYRIEA